MGAKTEPSCFPKLPNFENCPDVHYSTEILIQCGHTTREFVALAGASGDHLDQAGLGTFVLGSSWAILACQALGELSDVLEVGSGSLRKPRVSSASLVLRSLLCLPALQPSQENNLWSSGYPPEMPHPLLRAISALAAANSVVSKFL